MGMLKNIGDATKEAIKKELEDTEAGSGFIQFKNAAKEKLEKNGIISNNQRNEPRLSNNNYNSNDMNIVEGEIGEREIVGYCPNCGKKLTEKSKFCPGCGAQLEGPKSPQKEVVENDTPNKNIRQQEYIGKIYKCPNCGETVSPHLDSCPACGYHFVGKEATSSVQQFSEQLMRIEESRGQKGNGFGSSIVEGIFGSNETHDTEKKILSLIKSYPIPCSIDDIVEFMHLAIGNINVKLSKKKFIPTSEYSKTMEEKISDAWVAKMEQIYEMAEIHFPDDPAFSHVEKVYNKKMVELKLKSE